ncbi:MAG: hypothetical protein ACRD1G_18480, partial [Acidimicrobiales bacterium]
GIDDVAHDVDVSDVLVALDPPPFRDGWPVLDEGLKCSSVRARTSVFFPSTSVPERIPPPAT